MQSSHTTIDLSFQLISKLKTEKKKKKGGGLPYTREEEQTSSRDYKVTW